MKSIDAYTNYKQLGRGAEGTVYDIGDNKVMKVYARKRLPLYIQLLATCSDTVKVLPKIHDIGDNWYIRDALKTHTPKCKRYCNIISRYYNDLLKHKVPDITNSSDKDAIAWADRAMYEISQVMGSDKFGLGDWCIDNIGEDSNGNIIYFDW